MPRATSCLRHRTGSISEARGEQRPLIVFYLGVRCRGGSGNDKTKKKKNIRESSSRVAKCPAM